MLRSTVVTSVPSDRARNALATAAFDQAVDLLFHRLALEIWNQHPRRAPQLLGEFVYGVPERQTFATFSRSIVAVSRDGRTTRPSAVSSTSMPARGRPRW